MEYEGSIGLVSRKIKKKIADFNFFGLFMINNMILAINFFPSVTRRCRRRCRRRCVVEKIWVDASSALSTARKLLGSRSL
jgi:hypothetical protein